MDSKKKYLETEEKWEFLWIINKNVQQTISKKLNITPISEWFWQEVENDVEINTPIIDNTSKINV